MSSTTLISHITVKGDTSVPPLLHLTEVSSALSAPTKLTEEDDSTGGKDREHPQLTPTFLPLDSSASSSSSISPSSSITTDTSVACETNIGVLSDKNIYEKHEVRGRTNESNDDTIMPTIDPNADTDHKLIHATSMTAASTPASIPSTPASSSSTSIPLPTPFNSSTPTSTSPSTTNVNDLNVDANGLLSLLRPRPQINPNLNVKFAPLPELAPRKRKSSTPLGMAARSQLARRRRMIYRDSYDDDEMYEESYRPRRLRPPEISEKEEMEAADGQQESNTKKKNKKTKEGEAGKKEKSLSAAPLGFTKEGEHSEDEDPLAALAKKMGRAGKHLLRKMSIGGKVEKGDTGEDARKRNVADTPNVEQPSVDHEERYSNPQENPQETRDDSVKAVPTLLAAPSITLPSSEPQNVADNISATTSWPSSQEMSETAMTHEADPNLDNKLNDLPAMPTIVVSVA